MYIKPKYIQPHYSTKLWRGYFFYIKTHYSEDLFKRICDRLEMPLTYILGDDNWVSNDFLTDFLKELKLETKDESIAERAGEYSLSAEVINNFEYTLLQNMGPYFFFKSLPSQYAKMSLINSCSIETSRPGYFKIVVTPTSKIISPPDSCLNTVGVYRGINDIYLLDSLNVEHTNCIHRGDKKCIFDVRYDATTYWRKKIRNTLTYLVALTLLIYFSSYTKKIFSLYLDASYAYIFGMCAAFIAAFFAKKYMELINFNKTYYIQNRKKQQDIYESKTKLDRRYKEANLLRELSINLIKETNSKDVINMCLNELVDKFNYKRALVMLHDSNLGKLTTVEVRGFEKYNEIIYKLTVKYPAEKDNPQFFSNVLDRGQVEFVEDMEQYKHNLTAENQILLTALGVSSLIISPIQDHQNKYGLLVIGNLQEDQPFTNDDRHLLENVSNILSLFFQNAKNFEKERTLKAIFQKYVPSVVMDNLRLLDVGENTLSHPKSNTITSMFVDLRGFTQLSHSLDPVRVAELLNIYIDYTTDKIAEYGGIIDNLVGDGIVAFFPATQEHRTLHAKQGLMCAIDIIGRIDQLNAKLQDKGFGKVKIGIGLHSGNATIGNIGGRVRMNYTAIGDTVNVAARLESMCKEYSSSSDSASDGLIVLSDAVLRRAPLKQKIVSIDSIRIRGRDEEINIHLLDQKLAENLAGLEAHQLFKKPKSSKEIGHDLDGERREPIKVKGKKKQVA